MTSNFQTPPNPISHKSAHFPFYKKPPKTLFTKLRKHFSSTIHVVTFQSSKAKEVMRIPLQAGDTARRGSQQAALTTAVFSARAGGEEPVPSWGPRVFEHQQIKI